MQSKDKTIKSQAQRWINTEEGKIRQVIIGTELEEMSHRCLRERTVKWYSENSAETQIADGYHSTPRSTVPELSAEGQDRTQSKLTPVFRSLG
ncbi:hypothetical protein RRG08_050288 [Elysia crispata]|uniref:Uncharacterized protein n=1 Tax=Elysia crispata TaxID=231223 RepID=A0AAE1DXJ6_9GAST|nr:hypothetical protein RRG08_050288 [Elysia crispata]